MTVLLPGPRGGAEATVLAEREGDLTSCTPSQTQQSKFLTWQFDGEYRGDDYTATVTLGNPDLIGESGENWDRALFILAARLLLLAVFFIVAQFRD